MEREARGLGGEGAEDFAEDEGGVAGDGGFGLFEVVVVFLTAGEVGEGTDDEAGDLVGPADLGDGGGFHIEAGGLPDAEHPFSVGAVVHEDRSADAVAADGEGGGASTDIHGGNLGQGLAGHLEEGGVGGEEGGFDGLFHAIAQGPDFVGIHELEVFVSGLKEAGEAMAGAVGEGVGIDGFAVVIPAFGDHHVADMAVGVDASGDAGEEDGADGVAFEDELGGHGGVDHADAGGEDEEVVAGEGALAEGNAVEMGDGVGGGITEEQFAEGGDFRGVGAEDHHIAWVVGFGGGGGGGGGEWGWGWVLGGGAACGSEEEEAEQEGRAGEPRWPPGQRWGWGWRGGWVGGDGVGVHRVFRGGVSG